MIVIRMKYYNSGLFLGLQMYDKLVIISPFHFPSKKRRDEEKEIKRSITGSKCILSTHKNIHRPKVIIFHH